jgi:DNA processing protein
LGYSALKYENLLTWGLALRDNRQYWVGLNMVKGIGAVRLRSLLDFFGNAQTAWQAHPEELRATGIPVGIIDNLIKLRQSISLDVVWDQIQKQDIQVIIWGDEAYPLRLREIDNAPPLLYVRGSLEIEDEWGVAIVGTRRITSYGRQVAERIAVKLVSSGITIISGLALGVDTVAHQAALDGGGRTLAVLGCGVDRIYPPRNRQLAERILTSGALISDYPPGTPPEASNFPPRNRIISGLSLATVVVEAGEKSGALITADFAVDQGREVFAVPGNIFSPQSRGPNRLIQNGAHPLLDPQEILDNFDLQHVTAQCEARVVLPGNATEAQLFEILGHEPLHVDEIRAQTDLPIEDVTAALALMELKGMVRQVGGMRYTVIREPDAEYRTKDETNGQ